MGETNQDQHVVVATQQKPFLIMSHHCMEVKVKIQVDVMPMEMKELAIAKQAWEEKKASLER
jgi:hypothetical protein